jgi:integrase
VAPTERDPSTWRLTPDSPLDAAIATCVEDKSKRGRTGNTRAALESTLDRFHEWCTDRGVETVDDLSVPLLASYARHLADREESGAISARTAQAYYDRIASFCSWAVREELLDSNIARTNRAEASLPEDIGSRRSDQQFWPRQALEELYAYVDDRAREAVDARGLGARVELRDRALVAVLGYSGARSAEILRAPKDDRRTGVVWRDVDLDGGTIEVLGKSQQYENLPVPDRSRRALAQYRCALDPPTDEWPVFPTGHAPSRYDAAREALTGRGLDQAAIDERLGAESVDAILREEAIPPPALSTNGGRAVMRRLCEAAGVDVDGEYLKPHGGRRGLGDRLYRESAERAQSALRHSSIETTHKAYSHIDASDTAAWMNDVLDEQEDG